MNWQLQIDGVLIPNDRWSGPGTIRSGYRGIDGSREAGNCNFTVFRNEILTRAEGSAIQLDGSDDYVEVQNSAAAALTAICTIAFWLRRRTTGDSGVKVVLAKSGSSGVTFFARRQSGNQFRFYQYPSAAGYCTFVISDTNWHSVVIRNYGKGLMRAYVDGQPSGTQTQNGGTGTLASTPEPILIGCEMDIDGNRVHFADFEFDEVLYVNGRAWTDGEVADYHRGGLGRYMAAADDMLFGLHCDEGRGTTLNDFTGSGRNGILSGGGWIPSDRAIAESGDILQRDKIATVARNGIPRYRGIVTAVDRGRRDARIETAESGAALNALSAGMMTVGGLPNPDLFVYVREGMTGSWIPSGDDFPPAIQVFGIKPAAAYSGLTPFMDGSAILERQFLWDSFSYGRPRYSGAFDYHCRSNLWVEYSLRQIAERVAGAANNRRPGIIRGIEIGALPRGERSCFYVTDESGNLAGGNGFITRSIGGGQVTYAWGYAGGFIHIWQLVNRSFARYLGKILADGTNFDGQRLQPILNGSWGPFVVPVDPQFPERLAFYTGGVRADGDWLFTAARVYEIDLPRSFGKTTDNIVEHTYRDLAGGRTGSYYRWVVAQNGGYWFSATPQFGNALTSHRDGGYYGLAANNAAQWCGDMLLSEAAYDFREKTLGDVLSDLAMVSGCRWWIDGDGILRVERTDRSGRTAVINARSRLSDRTTDAALQEYFDEWMAAGIPLGNYGLTALRRELNRLAGSGWAQTRTIKLIARAEPDYQLGAKQLLDGEDVGRLAAVEHTDQVDTLELDVPESRSPVKK